MQKIKHIKYFFFGSARYHLDDGAGDKVLLLVDYWHNKYHIRSQTKITNPKFRKEIQLVANNLLGRKHHQNFVSHLKTSQKASHPGGGT